MAGELSVTISGDKFVEAILKEESSDTVTDSIATIIEAEVAHQTQARVDRWSEETDRAVDYQPDLSVTVTR